MECFASDTDVVLYGTVADEKRIGLEQIWTQVERGLAQSESAAISFTWISGSAVGAAAWAGGDGAFKFRVDRQDMTFPARVSFVLEKREGK